MISDRVWIEPNLPLLLRIFGTTSHGFPIDINHGVDGRVLFVVPANLQVVATSRGFWSLHFIQL